MPKPFFTAKRIASILSLPIAEDFQFTRITTDSREIQSGDLFLALSGENQDGHQYISQALAKGAKGIIHKQDFSCPKQAISFPVANTLHAYTAIAQAWRREFSYPVLAIAGSSGKTTSKELLAAILRGKFPQVHLTAASQNGFTGIPATLLKLNSEFGAAVIEVGIDEPNTMEHHLETVSPTGGLLSSIGPEHLEKLIDIATVAKEEGKVFEYLDQHLGIIAVNADDPLILQAGQKIKKSKPILYGLDNSSAEIRGRISENELFVSGLSGGTEHFSLTLEGKHNALNLLGALTLAHAIGLSPDEMRQGLASFIPPPGRSEVHHWRGEVKVYADTYNANPASVEAAIEMLTAKAATMAQNWVCLGDMLELGPTEEKLHRALAGPIQKHQINHVLLFGDRMKALAQELAVRKFAGTVRYFAKIEDLASTLASELRAKDRVLIKGSRGMRMERVWEILAKSALES